MPIAPCAVPATASARIAAVTPASSASSVGKPPISGAGPAGRDATREREIVARMAELAPGLGVDRMRRIVDTIITESLDAAD